MLLTEKLGVGLEVSEEDKAKADLLVKMLRERFHEHLKQRIKDKARRTHWSMQHKNFAVDAALMANFTTGRRIGNKKGYTHTLKASLFSLQQPLLIPVKCQPRKGWTREDC